MAGDGDAAEFVTPAQREPVRSRLAQNDRFWPTRPGPDRQLPQITATISSTTSSGLLLAVSILTASVSLFVCSKTMK